MKPSSSPILRTLGILVGSLFMVLGPPIPVSRADSTPMDFLGAVVFLAMGAAFVRYGILGTAVAKIRRGPVIVVLSVLAAAILASMSLYTALRDVDVASLSSILYAIGIVFGVVVVVHAVVQRRQHQELTSA